MPRKKVPGTSSSSETPKKVTTNSIDSTLTLSTNEKILKTIFDIYSDKETGLEEIAKEIDLQGKILAPQKKITVMLCGNHSSGKSSFINWYIGETVQKTGVAMETAAFTLITSGRRRETLKGDASLHYWPRIANELKGTPGIPDYLQTEITVSTERRFSMVTFIDTPGLVDGHQQYPYPVEDILVKLAKQADLIFIFLDPMGKAGCKRTMNVAERLIRSPHLAKKIRFYLTKADSLVDALDRQKVIIQITQNLTSVLNTVNFDLPTIYIPASNGEDDATGFSGRTKNIPNSIDAVCKEIEDTINQSVQNAINTLDNDCTTINNTIDNIVKDEENKRKDNSQARNKGLMYGLIALILPILFLPIFFLTFRKSLPLLFGSENAFTKIIDTLGSGVDAILGGEQKFYVLLVLILVCLVLIIMSKYTWKSKPTRTTKQINKIKSFKTIVSSVAALKQDLYSEFFQQLRSTLD